MPRICHVAAVIAITGLLGCYTEIDSANAPPPPPSTETATATPKPVADMPSSGGNSTLGKAKQSAKNTVSDLEARQRDIEKQLEDDDG